jgi:opacity protein-like surface antigen
MSLKKIFFTVVVAAAASAFSPRTASADWTLTPFVGWNFGGSADVSGNGGVSTTNRFEHKVNYGVSAAAMGKGIIGGEIDFGYSPNFFANTVGNNGFNFSSDNNVMTLTGNVIVGIPAGGHGAQVRPYAVGGVGLIRQRVGAGPDASGNLFNVNSKNDFGYDLGAGVMGFFTQNVGLRGDVRYFRSFQGSTSPDSVTGLALSGFHFWRGSVGVALKF